MAWTVPPHPDLSTTDSRLWLLPPRVDPDVLQAVAECLQAARVFEATYRGRYQAQSKVMKVNLLALLLRDQTLYLIATINDQRDPVQLALHRISRVSTLEQPARSLPDFDNADYSKGAAVRFPVGDRLKIRLRFSEEAGFHLTESALSDDQRIDQQADGSYRVHATVADTAQLRWWLLGFGSGVEVLGPKALRREIADHAEAMARCYGAQPDG